MRSSVKILFYDWNVFQDLKMKDLRRSIVIDSTQYLWMKNKIISNFSYVAVRRMKANKLQVILKGL